MRCNSTVLLIGAALWFLLSLTSVRGDSMSIRLNSLGFLPEMPKRATVSAHGDAFSVRSSEDNAVVYTGQMTGPFHQEDIHQEVWMADFSAPQNAGPFFSGSYGSRAVD